MGRRSHLYVASAVYSTTSASSIKVWRFSYSTNSKSYSLDSGFPVTVSSGGAEAVVLETDTAGVAWVTFTQNNKVWVTHSVRRVPDHLGHPVRHPAARCRQPDL